MIRFLFALALFVSVAHATPALAADAGTLDAPAGAVAAPVALPSIDSPESIVTAVLEAVGTGNWRLLAALAVIVVAFVARKAIGLRFAWVRTDGGGFLLNWIASFGVVVAPVIYAGKAWSLSLAVSLVSLSLTASGGYVALKKAIGPVARWLWGKLAGSKA
jgi:hypothetical protein